VLALRPGFGFAATDTFSRKNTNRTIAEHFDRLIEAAKLAERVVGHEVPGTLKQGGNLASYRALAAASS